MSTSRTSGPPETTAGSSGGRDRAVAFLLPERVTGWTRFLAWATMIANALLIATGGAVRLTGSGLGCPTWPRCTPESWTNTPEMGIHGVIEFGNRTLTGLLVVIAVLTALSVLRVRDRHPLLLQLAVGIGVLIIAQAVIGGITVRTGLNPWVVGVHFVVSAVIVAMGAVMVNRTRRLSLPRVAEAERPGLLAADRGLARPLAAVLGAASALAIYLGTLVTGTGPHSGDAGEVVRHAFDPYVVARIHVVPVYVLVAASLAGVVLAFVRGWPAAVRRILVVVAVVVALQGAIGYYQWWNAVPALSVWFHMVGAATLAAVATMAVEKIWWTSASEPVELAPGDRPDRLTRV